MWIRKTSLIDGLLIDKNDLYPNTFTIFIGVQEI